MIKQYKTGLYYVLKELEEISGFMSKNPLTDKIPVTLIAAEKMSPMTKGDEAKTWKECLKSFGALPNHRYVLAKDAGHKVWEDDPEIVIDEVTALYERVN